MTEYVVGFMFDVSRTEVLLIRKNRPNWQSGALNGVGGKIEYREPPICAMIREFYEEAGIRTEYKDWTEVCKLECKNGAIVHFFSATGNLERAIQMTDEKLEITPVRELHNRNTISNLQWLIHFANWNEVEWVAFKERYR